MAGVGNRTKGFVLVEVFSHMVNDVQSALWTFTGEQHVLDLFVTLLGKQLQLKSVRNEVEIQGWCLFPPLS